MTSHTSSRRLLAAALPALSLAVLTTTASAQMTTPSGTTSAKPATPAVPPVAPSASTTGTATTDATAAPGNPAAPAASGPGTPAPNANAVANAAPNSAVADPTMLTATLDPASEVPGPGKAGGTGALKARMFIKDGKFCYTLTSTGLSALTAAHIHAGAAGVAGDPIVTLIPSVPSETCLKIDSALATKIAADPASYYVNIHTQEMPKGAIRGQLAKSAE